jgi:hypothetical protein
VAGQQWYTSPGTYTWRAPDNIRKVTVVCVAGGGGAGTYIPSLGDGQSGSAGGGGGELLSSTR